ncbi:MAG: DNA-directed RNA polymerase subunit alpha C-terminal domain-containing protein [Anaerolineaceae bacterium]
MDSKKTRENEKTSLERTIVELELGTRPTDALDKAGIKTVGQVMAKFEEGDDAVLAIDGFGRKSLIDLKKRLRQLGYTLPQDTEAA